MCKYGEQCYRKSRQHKKDYSHPGDEDWVVAHPLDNVPICPCGGGQSCVVDRRALGDWVYEDDIFKQAGLQLRKNCHDPLTPKHEEVLKQSLTCGC